MLIAPHEVGSGAGALSKRFSVAKLSQSCRLVLLGFTFERNQIPRIDSTLRPRNAPGSLERTPNSRLDVSHARTSAVSTRLSTPPAHNRHSPPRRSPRGGLPQYDVAAPRNSADAIAQGERFAV